MCAKLKGFTRNDAKKKKTVKKARTGRAFPLMSHCVNTRLNAGIMWLRTSANTAENTEPCSGDNSNLLVLAEEFKSRRNTGSYLVTRCVRPARCSVDLPIREQMLKHLTAQRTMSFMQQFNIIR